MVEYTKEEIVAERASILEEMPHDRMMTMDELKERYQSTIGYTEVLHAAYMLMENVDGYLLQSPSVILDETAFELAFKAHTMLFNLYQRLGSLRNDVTE